MVTRRVSDAARPAPAPLTPPTPLTVSPAVRDTLEHLPPLVYQTSPCRSQRKVTARDASPLTCRRSRERCVPPPPRTPRSLRRHAGPPPHSKLRGRGCSPRGVVTHEPPRPMRPPPERARHARRRPVSRGTVRRPCRVIGVWDGAFGGPGTHFRVRIQICPIKSDCNTNE